MAILNEFTHLTAKERSTISFPARILLERNLLLGDVLDYGCGLGSDVTLLKEKGVKIGGFDPHYFPEQPTGKYDTIICFYVLNVLMQEEQSDVIMEISALLKPNGKAYFAVRRDITYEGFRMHKIHQKPTYQCNVKLPFVSIFLNDYCEIYAYQPYTTIHTGNIKISPFFNDDQPRDLIYESGTSFSFFDKYPVSKGHALVVPKRLVSNYFDLNIKEQMSCWIMVNKVKSFLQNRFNPDGFNIGINIQEAAGQSVPHCHIHVIPRYTGDVDTPRGGVRGVIPGKQNY
ncbi:MAG TPA: bifunctional class I SAM-dependent methyltransferase/HIT family protein [Saprospiraceae bacterium]|nr:bifunctional class I SAM-dependent methyltransferase/HIT family protein [Saprospiraceae bacterium]HMU02083.1 bifunctional class I SAM-dependent methyltransferase/HIT family protein [Saprospiraceae bacterium]